MKNKTKSIIYAICGVFLLFYGCYIFLTNDVVQNVIMGFAMMGMGSVMFGWNMAYYQHNKDNQ